MKKDDFERFVLFIENLASVEVNFQKEDGSFAVSNNGPHGDEETPVRNTSHWLYMLSWLVSQGYSKYYLYANRSADYLLSDDARPMKNAFWCRKNPFKDSSNGLIGQAWVIESLLYASKKLARPDLQEVAKEVHMLHFWDDSSKAWRNLNVDGSYGVLNGTFNQQLWFAAVGSMIENYDLGKKRAIEYLDNIEKNIFLYRDGVIFHNSNSFLIKTNNFKSVVKKIYAYKKTIKKMKGERERSVGYHAFNLVALKYLKNSFPSHCFWKSKKYRKIKEVFLKKTFYEDLKINKFGYAYNPVYYEYLYYLDKAQEPLDLYLKEQNKILKVFDDVVFVSDSLDHEISKSRVYELCRALDQIKEFIHE
ncbi:hypothetical protein [Thiothrix subterranea]|uniref:Agl cluster protein AglQ n=1 Tax=Thiothrix subterranea TaxID=2735563 RepID=A0AA51MJW2_9GAMM|nr:hypothetical protein [Thiothrix subterranea]MDQ5770307.1 hypothetical protein [Thiothrix subterranea]WML85849.1 hypothetical protein RCG00_16285 [Thiothrix subterranea]